MIACFHFHQGKKNPGEKSSGWQIYQIKNYLFLSSSLISVNKISVEEGAGAATSSFF
jgi:hypothetical protein